MNVEDLVRRTLHEADHYVPSPDLFARVQRSVTEDLEHRRRIRSAIVWTGVGLLFVAAWLAATVTIEQGRLSWPWWSLEVLVSGLLVVLVVVLGPLLRRFGSILAESAFQANPTTGHEFLRVLDLAYYLVFGSFVVLSSTIVPDPEWLLPGGLSAQLADLTERAAVMLLLMGVLHSLTIAVLPVLGVVFSDTWRRGEDR